VSLIKQNQLLGTKLDSITNTQKGIVFTKEKDSDQYYVNAFGAMFSALKENDSKTEGKVARVKEIEKEVSKLLTERNKILKSIGQCDDRQIKF
jgi:hypothetical protein